MALILLDPNYQPPTGYGVLMEHGFDEPRAANWVYEMVEFLKGTKWWPREYGCDPNNFAWRGMMDSFIWGGQTAGAGTVWFLLPASTWGSEGLGVTWMAFHSENSGFHYSVNPWLAGIRPDYIRDWQGGVSHELFEALTDSPPGRGWVHDQAYVEGADLCGTYTPWINLGGWALSSWYSNQLGRCLQEGDLW